MKRPAPINTDGPAVGDEVVDSTADERTKHAIGLHELRKKVNFIELFPAAPWRPTVVPEEH